MSFIDGCNKDICPIEDTIYGYAPALGANATFLALFGFSGLVQLVQGLYFYRTGGFWSYSFPIILGCITEIIGYIGRLMEHFEPFSSNGFYIQICCLTIAPAFLTAGIYFCLGDLIKLFDPECRCTRLKNPRLYAYIFIPCDIIALVLQAAGGGLAATAVETDDNPDPGTNVMIAGLAWQVFSLLIFIILTADFSIRVSNYRRKTRSQGLPATPGDFNKEIGGSLPDDSASFDAEQQRHEPIMATNQVNRTQFAMWAIPFALAILTIFTRCCYRVAELSGGWTGHLIREQGTFIGLEGVLVVVGTLFLNVSHPAFLSMLRT